MPKHQENIPHHDIGYINKRIQYMFEKHLVRHIIPQHILELYPRRIAEITPLMFLVIILRTIKPYGNPTNLTDTGQEVYDTLVQSLSQCQTGKRSAFHLIFQVMQIKRTIVNHEECNKHRLDLRNNARGFLTENIPGTADWLRMISEYIVGGTLCTPGNTTEATVSTTETPQSGAYSVDVSYDGIDFTDDDLDGILSSINQSTNFVISTNIQ